LVGELRFRGSGRGGEKLIRGQREIRTIKSLILRKALGKNKRIEMDRENEVSKREVGL